MKRYNLVMSVSTWDDLRAHAARREMTVAQAIRDAIRTACSKSIDDGIVEPATTVVDSDVHKCARCRGEHHQLAFTPFNRPVGAWTHWAMCPETGQPILLRIVHHG